MGSVVTMFAGCVQFDVCAEAEETVERQAHDTSHQCETAAPRNTRLKREYYGSPSCEGQASVVSHKNYKHFVKKIYEILRCHCAE